MTQKNNGSIGTDLLKSLYTNPEITQKNPQPYYIVHKDTMKTFLHENKGSLSIVDRFLTILVSFITILLTYFTSNFKETEVFGLDGSQIKGCFLCLLIVFGVYLVYLIYELIRTRHMRDVDSLCSMLEKRVTVLTQTDNKTPGV